MTSQKKKTAKEKLIISSPLEPKSIPTKIIYIHSLRHTFLSVHMCIYIYLGLFSVFNKNGSYYMYYTAIFYS